MTKRRKVATWIALVLSLPAGGYAGMSVIFYAWVTAAQPESWSPARAAPWVYGALAFTVLLLALFVYCVVSLIRDANETYQRERNAT